MRATDHDDDGNTAARELATALIGGLAGAAALTAVHQAAKAYVPHAPRVDVLGRRAIAKTLASVGVEPPKGRALQGTALAGDLLSNALFYALIGTGHGRRAWLKGTLLGAAAGLGAVLLPPALGLGRQPTRRTPQTMAMTVLWYLLGGIVAAGVVRAVREDDDDYDHA